MICQCYVTPMLKLLLNARGCHWMALVS